MFPNWFKDVQPFFERNCPYGPLRVLQIGTYTGDATAWLLENRDIQFIHDVDTWEGSEETAHETINFSDVYAYYQSRFRDDNNVIEFQCSSDEFFANGYEGTYNFIYIDGDHTAAQTLKDALNAFDMLDSGGVMAFDDYLWNYNGNPTLEPKRGVDAFLSVYEGQYEVIESGYQVWIRKC